MNLNMGHQSYHEVDGASTAQHVGTRHDSSAPIKPLRRAGIVERCCFGVQLQSFMSHTKPIDMLNSYLHIARIDPGAIYPEAVNC